MASAAISLNGRSLLDFDDRDCTEPKPRLFADRAAKGIETLRTTELTGDAFWLSI